MLQHEAGIPANAGEPGTHTISGEEVRAQLQRILGSAPFSRSKRLSRFLTFVVEQTLEGHEDALKEYQVGVTVCLRPSSYDPRTDPVVRVEARRLRSALEAYYANGGKEDRVIISLPKGGYVPCFSGSPQTPLAPARELKDSTRWRRTWTLGLLAAVALAVVAVAGYFLGLGHSKSRLTDKDTVVIAEFENATGDAVFDDTLRRALSAQLEQSPYLNLLSETRTVQTFGLMGQAKDAELTGEIARQVCERTGSTATIEGSISKLGNQYAIGLKSVNCHTGDVLAEAMETADGKEKVLTALGAASTKLRKQLGESLASVQKFDVPPENVTTPSLEALHAYSLGFKVHVVSFDEAAAAALFQRAVTLDPNFAMAYARMAICYANLGEFSRVEENMRRAYALRERASENEKLLIISMYHEFVTGDLEAARKVYELRAQMYPRDDLPIGNLGNVYFNLGQYDKALVATKEALRRNPTSRIWYGNLVSIYMAQNQPAQAEEAIAEARSRQLDSTWLHLCSFLTAFQQGDSQTMEREGALVRNEPGFEDVLLYYQSQAAAHAGRLKESRALTQRAIESARRADHIDSAAFYLAEEAVREALFGNLASANRQARAALQQSHSRDTEATAGPALALSGDSVEAARLANDLEKRFPEDTIIRYRYLPMIRAATALYGNAASKNPQAAVEALAATEPYELGSQTMVRAGFLTCYPIYLRGQAFLAAGQGGLAVLEFEKLAGHRQLTLTDPVGALARLGLARAYALSGDHARSRKAYEELLSLGKNADPDLPIGKLAMAEAAELHL